MKAEALEIIDEVVTRRDPGKEFLHPRGALIPGGIKFVGHAGRRLPEAKINAMLA
jgi:hypothetical protein